MAKIGLPGSESRECSWPESIFFSDSLFCYAPTQGHVAAMMHNHKFGDLKQYRCTLSQFSHLAPRYGWGKALCRGSSESLSVPWGSWQPLASSSVSFTSCSHPCVSSYCIGVHRDNLEGYNDKDLITSTKTLY